MFDGVKIFSVTRARDRERLSDDITRWITDHPDRRVIDRVVRQSSDAEFHCLSILLFYRHERT